MSHPRLASSPPRRACSGRGPNLKRLRYDHSSMLAVVFVLYLFVPSVIKAEATSPDRQHEAGTDSPAIRCLILTGEDYPGHRWQETAPVLKKLLEKQGDIAVDVVEDLRVLTTDSPFRYDVLVMHFKNYDPEVPGKKGFETLQEFVRQGGGLVLVHFACGAFQEFKDDFVRLAGRVWDPQLSGHDPYGVFTVRVTDRDHPITRGLTDFQTVDELYTCLSGDVPIHVLATAQSKVDGKEYPMAFALEVGKGRVFHCVLGHDVKAFESEAVQELYRRGCLWCARRLGD